MRVLNHAFDQPMELEERAADPLAGGLMQGYQCGQIWGAALAAGGQAYRLLGAGPQAEAAAVIASQRIVESFRAKNNNIDCRAITGIDLSAPKPGMIISFLLKSGPTGSCFGMAARCAKAAFDEINATFSEETIEALPAPASCAGRLAQKMGASDLQTAMAAGLAGGIGLSGNACGALGATIWINTLTWCRKHPGETPPAFNKENATKILKAFNDATGSEILCHKITGQRFKTINEHTEFINNGGCDKLINVLALEEI